MIRQWTTPSVLITITLFLLSFLPVQAQQNLLQNPGFESDYGGRMGRGDFTFPAGWDGWFAETPRTEYWMNVPPTGYPHNGPFRRSGASAQSIAKGGGSFTAAALQRVPNIPAGAIVRGSAWVYIENNEGTNAQVRIGIGSNVGTNVNGAITWSDWEKRLNGLQQISVDHVATGGEVTLFIYTTQTWPNDPNAVYIDDASLTIVGEGEVPGDSDGGGNNVVVEPPRPSGVPFVAPQDSGEGGAITHIVRAGDTLASIAVAYRVSVDEIVALNGLDTSSFLQLDQKLIISTPDPTRINSEVQTAEDDSASPVETVVATEIPSNNPIPADTQGKTSFPVVLITQQSASVRINSGVANTFSLTFVDSQFRMVQVMPEFTGGDLSPDSWIQFWNTNPSFVIQDAMLIVDNFTLKLSLSAFLYNEADNSITYTAVIERVINSQGEAVDMATLPQDIFNNPAFYFQADPVFLNAIPKVAELIRTPQ